MFIMVSAATVGNEQGGKWVHFTLSLHMNSSLVNEMSRVFCQFYLEMKGLRLCNCCCVVVKVGIAATLSYVPPIINFYHSN
jgi:hypothetical protein